MFLRSIVFLLFVLAFGQSAHAEKKVALLLGNAAYSHDISALRNPPNDVAALKQTLQAAGFEVFDHINLSRAGMSRVLNDFEQEARSADIGVVFYSGHGIEVNGTNYLLPIDAVLAAERDVKYEAIALDDVLETLSRVSKLKLVLLDACRDDPFFSQLKKAGTRGIASKGLARIDSPASDGNFLIGYATAPGQVASDGNANNSPYTQALIKHLAEPGVDIEVALRNVARDVVDATKGGQRPYKSGSMLDAVSLASVPATSTADTVSRTEVDPCGDAASTYSSISNATDKAVFEDYLQRFGKCGFAALAEKQIARLDNQPVALVIGNSQYAHVAPLPNAADDARAVGAALNRLGFRVTEAIDLTKPALVKSLADFSRASKNAEKSVIYFSGHGFESDGNNCLVPVDATLSSPAEIPSQCAQVADLVEATAGARLWRLVLVDAGRNNPFSSSRPSATGGKVPADTFPQWVAQRSDLVLAYATSPNSVALDGDGPISPFATALVSNFDKDGIDIRSLLHNVAAEVQNATEQRQTQMFYSSLQPEGNFPLNSR